MYESELHYLSRNTSYSYPLNTMDMATSGLKLKGTQKLHIVCLYGTSSLIQRIKDGKNVFLYLIITSNLWCAFVQVPAPWNADENPKLCGCIARMYQVAFEEYCIQVCPSQTYVL